MTASAYKNWSSLTARNLFVVSGLTGGVMVHLLARLHVDIEVVQSRYTGGSAAASIGLAGQTPLSVSRYTPLPTGGHFLTDLDLHFDATSLRPFELAMSVEAYGGSEGGGGWVTTRLDLLGLPPGARLTSCYGYPSETPTPVEPALVAAEYRAGHVHLEWTAGADVRNVVLYRRSSEADWTALAVLQPDAHGTLVFEDERVAPAIHYDYRLGVGEAFSVMVGVDVPAAGATLRVDTPRVLRAGHPLRLDLELPASGEASVQWFDVGGRRLRAIPLGMLPAGPQQLTLGAPELPAGLYFLRLLAAGQSATSRVVVVH